MPDFIKLRLFPMPNRNLRKIVVGIASLVFGVGLAGCGGGGISKATRLTLIESLEIESEIDRTVLVVQGNKEFEARIVSE